MDFDRLRFVSERADSGETLMAISIPERTGTLCYVMLCYVMLCYVILCSVMLCYVILCYVMLCYVLLSILLKVYRDHILYLIKCSVVLIRSYSNF